MFTLPESFVQMWELFLTILPAIIISLSAALAVMIFFVLRLDPKEEPTGTQRHKLIYALSIGSLALSLLGLSLLPHNFLEESVSAIDRSMDRMSIVYATLYLMIMDFLRIILSIVAVLVASVNVIFIATFQYHSASETSPTGKNRCSDEGVSPRALKQSVATGRPMTLRESKGALYISQTVVIITFLHHILWITKVLKHYLQGMSSSCYNNSNA